LVQVVWREAPRSGGDYAPRTVELVVDVRRWRRVDVAVRPDGR
jgi:hypothetical protein